MGLNTKNFILTNIGLTSGVIDWLGNSSHSWSFSLPETVAIKWDKVICVVRVKVLSAYWIFPGPF
jgi:hypothetical protein